MGEADYAAGREAILGPPICSIPAGTSFSFSEEEGALADALAAQLALWEQPGQADALSAPAGAG